MKKLFVSVPIEGRKEAYIRFSMERMKEIAEATVGEELEMLTTYIVCDQEMVGKDALYPLGLRISAMKQADYVAILDESYRFNDASIEVETAGRYKIPMIHCSMEYACPDIPAANFRQEPIIPWDDDQ